MIRNVQNTIEEYQALNPTSDIPEYEEVFPKPEKDEKEPAKIIPDFKELPVFQFKEPPVLQNLNPDTNI